MISKEFINKEPMIMVTPDMAKELLATNIEDNRNLSVATVKDYSRRMTSGGWMDFYPNDSIIVSDKGHLINGQHRLNAVIVSNVSVGFEFRWDLDEEVFAFLDNGKKRNAADFVKGKYYNERAALTKAVLLAEHGKTFMLFGKGQNVSCSDVYAPSREDIARRANDDTIIYECCAKGKNTSRCIRGLPSTTIASFCWIVASTEGPWNDIDRFLAELTDDFTSNITARVCQKMFKEMLYDTKVSVKKSYKIAVLLKGYTSFKANSTAKSFRKIEECRDEYEQAVKVLFNKEVK